jgi:hypothetical protein
MQDLVAAPHAAAAAWLDDGSVRFSYRVDGLLPHFPAYARVFHPAHCGTTEVRWSTVAAACGRTMHPAAEWGSLVGSGVDAGARRWDRDPEVGNLPAAVAARLIPVLRAHTTSPEQCWFAAWEGWGGLADGLRRAPVFDIPNRTMHLLTGSIAAATGSVGDEEDRHQSPSLWWPADRSWCVATEIDLMTTYIGASRECVAALLATPALEVLAVAEDQSLTWDADTINPRPAGPYYG